MTTTTLERIESKSIRDVERQIEGVLEKAGIDTRMSKEQDSINEFQRWESASRDTIDLKRCYVDLAGDLVTGVLLSQIIYWFLPDKHGNDKPIVEREGKLWIAKERADWWEECRITPKQFDRSIKILREKGFVSTRLFQFGYPSSPTVHVNLNTLAVSQGVKRILTKGENGNYPKVKKEITQTVKTYSNSIRLQTKTTSTETTKENNIIIKEKKQENNKCLKNFLLMGYMEDKEKPKDRFYSLILGLPGENGDFYYSGRCPSGVNSNSLKRVKEQIQLDVMNECPFGSTQREELMRTIKKYSQPNLSPIFVHPSLVLEMSVENRANNKFKILSFKRLRPDLTINDLRPGATIHGSAEPV